MNDISKYYESILKKAEEYFQEKKYLKAIELLQDELEAPYMPLDQIPKFEEKLIEYQYAYNYDNPKKSMVNSSKEELKEIIQKKAESSNLAIINFFSKYANDFSNNDSIFFLDILKSKDYNCATKINVMTLLKINNINLDIEFYNPFTKSTHYLKSLECKSIEEYPYFMAVRAEIESQTAKEPWMLEMCYVTLYQYYISYFPKYNLSSVDPAKFALIMMNTIKSSIEGKSPHEDEISKDIYEAIKNQE